MSPLDLVGVSALMELTKGRPEIAIALDDQRDQCSGAIRDRRDRAALVGVPRRQCRPGQAVRDRSVTPRRATIASPVLDAWAAYEVMSMSSSLLRTALSMSSRNNSVAWM